MKPNRKARGTARRDVQREEPVKVFDSDEESYDFPVEVTSKVRDSIQELSEIPLIMHGIKNQNAFAAALSQGKNDKEIAHNVSVLASAQMKSLDIIWLLLGASVRNKADYETVIQELNNYETEASDNNLALEELIKIKRVVIGLKEKDAQINSLRLTTTISIVVAAVSMIIAIAALAQGLI